MSSGPRVRFAPSPTGFLHIGGARTALFNWLYAKRKSGIFVLRMEDTDQVRSTPASVQAIFDGLKWLGLTWDEGPEVGGQFGPYFQTQRLDSYRKTMDNLIAQGHAYRCYCTREEIAARRAVAEKEKRTFKYEGTCRELKNPPADRPSVVRFRMPPGNGSVSFTDKVIGPITKLYSDLEDWVMLRNDGIPLYNFGCVVDDHEMEISLVVRGQEHINSTFPQLMLYQALKWNPPEFAHLPLILGQDREKLSKRKHDEADVMNHKKNGIHPEALLNFVVRLGWSHGNDELITIDQMKEWFDFDHVGSTSGVWSPERLLWVNEQWMKMLPVETVAERLLPFLHDRGHKVANDDRLKKIIVALRARAKTLVEMAEMAPYFFTEGVTLDEKAAAKHVNADTKPLLTQVREALVGLSSWDTVALDGVIKTVSEKAGVGMGKIAQPVRVAVTGNTASPGIGETLEIIGREESLRRVDAALARP
ncbi:MAG: glutamate--tRNA ligase [Myxococcaceae bacterium]